MCVCVQYTVHTHIYHHICGGLWHQNVGKKTPKILDYNDRNHQQNCLQQQSKVNGCTLSLSLFFVYAMFHIQPMVLFLSGLQEGSHILLHLLLIVIR